MGWCDIERRGVWIGYWIYWTHRSQHLIIIQSGAVANSVTVFSATAVSHSLPAVHNTH
jgi:hypothetical protein